MKLYGLLLFLFFVGTTPAWAQTADEIVNKANLASYYAGKSGQSDVVMTITDAQGRQRTREFRILRLNVKEGGEQKFYVYFRRPTDVARMVYMVWKNIGKDDDRWLYLPALDLVKRVAATDKRSSFAGSHFVYEDVSGRGVDADIHELIGEEGGLFKIKNAPKETKGVEFAYYFVWIDKTNFLPMKAEYYNASGKLLRTVEALEIKDVQGYPTAVKSQATDVERKGSTIIDFTNVVYDVGIEDGIFTERYLRQPPTQWVQ